MLVMVAPLTVASAKPATFSSPEAPAPKVLLAVKAEVVATAPATATPASRTRDIRIAVVLFSQWRRAGRRRCTRSGWSCAVGLTSGLRPGSPHSQLLSQKKLGRLGRNGDRGAEGTRTTADGGWHGASAGSGRCPSAALRRATARRDARLTLREPQPQR